jgi:PIN domain nuclease of toxin-antitoxin system
VSTLLLDTQVALWLLDDNPRLGAKARNTIHAATVVHVSAASLWEIAIKEMLGKLRVPPDFSELITSQGLVLLSVTAKHTEAIRAFPELLRHDPFDRLLMAQSRVDGLSLVTADRVLLAGGYDGLVDARR